MSIIRVGIEGKKSWIPSNRENPWKSVWYSSSSLFTQFIISFDVQTGWNWGKFPGSLLKTSPSLVPRLYPPPVCKERAQERGLLDWVPCYLEYGMVWVSDRYPVQHGKGHIGDHGLLHGYSRYPYVSSNGGRRRNGRSTCVYAKRR